MNIDAILSRTVPVEYLFPYLCLHGGAGEKGAKTVEKASGSHEDEGFIDRIMRRLSRSRSPAARDDAAEQAKSEEMEAEKKKQQQRAREEKKLKKKKKKKQAKEDAATFRNGSSVCFKGTERVGTVVSAVYRVHLEGTDVDVVDVWTNSEDQFKLEEYVPCSELDLREAADAVPSFKTMGELRATVAGPNTASTLTRMFQAYGNRPCLGYEDSEQGGCSSSNFCFLFVLFQRRIATIVIGVFVAKEDPPFPRQVQLGSFQCRGGQGEGCGLSAHADGRGARCVCVCMSS